MFGLYLGVFIYVTYEMDSQSLNLKTTEHQKFKEGLIFSCAKLS